MASNLMGFDAQPRLPQPSMTSNLVGLDAQPRQVETVPMRRDHDASLGAIKASFSGEMPRNDRGEVASIGSLKHAEGGCSPCLFWFRKSCAKGVHCDYCHFRHKGQRNKRIRPSKKTRMQMRAGNGQPGGDDSDENEEDDNVEALQDPVLERL
jgi:hypothetical protein